MKIENNVYNQGKLTFIIMIQKSTKLTNFRKVSFFEMNLFYGLD